MSDKETRVEVVEKEKQTAEVEKKPEETRVEVVDKRRMSREERQKMEDKEKLLSWVPKTELGRKVKSGKIKNINEVFDSSLKIMESEIVDLLLNLKSDLLNIGQSKGKFGGGKRRPWRQTQKKTKKGNVVSFAVMAVVGDCDGHIGIGYGKSKETLPAREKGIRKAKLEIMEINRGCGSYDCSCHEPHSIPFIVEGKCSSVRVKLMPAPKGTGLVASDELKKILKLSGIKDVYSKTFGKTRTTINTVKACISALEKLGGTNQ